MKPNYERSILNLISSITAKFGLVPKHKPLDMQILGTKFEKANNVVLLLVDAMGYNIASEIVENDESEFKCFGIPKKLSTIFPSTTVNVLSTIATESSPIEHGMLGYILYLKEFGTLTNMIDFSPIGMPHNSLVSRGANPSNFLGVPTVYERLRNYGVNPLVITANAFKESGLSKTLNHNAAVQGYMTKIDMMTKLRRAVESEKHSYIYAYWPMVDAMGHVYGPDSEEYREEIKDTLRKFKRIVYNRLKDSLRDETIFLVVADHGQIRTHWKKDWIISPEDDFVSTLESMPCGEPRMMYLYTRFPQKTIEAGLNFFKGNVDFFESEKMVKDGMFGPGDPYKRSLSRIGDLLAIPKSDHSFTMKYLGNERHLKGKHGGISKEELEIPMFIL